MNCRGICYPKQNRVDDPEKSIYRTGQDSIAWHSDDEPELGGNPVIGSVSLGNRRNFALKHKFDKAQQSIKFELTHGSFLLMRGRSQQDWLHQIPKIKRPVTERINLTFRTLKLGA